MAAPHPTPSILGNASSKAISDVPPEKLVPLKAAARLAGVHPVVLEMADRLVKDPARGVRFALDATMRRQSSAIEEEIRRGLKRCATGYGRPDLKVRSYVGDAHEYLVFWYDVKQTRAPRKQ